MSVDFQVSADNFSVAGLGSAVACAVATAVADGVMDESEQRGIANLLCALIGVDPDTGASLVAQGLEKAASTDRDSLFEEARNMLDGSGREGCFVLACAIAARSKGIGASEGAVLQKLASALEIGYPSATYTKLLSAGMQLGRAG